MSYPTPSIGRFRIVLLLAPAYLILSLTLRLVFLFWQYNEVSWNLIDVLSTLFVGLAFDIGCLLFFFSPAVVYLSVFPSRWVGSWFDRGIVYLFTGLGIVILVFVFFAEVTFWEEFGSRFNFIAVDYLIYTHEVVANINESYPLPLLIPGIFLISAMLLYALKRFRGFSSTFHNKPKPAERVWVILIMVLSGCFYIMYVPNHAAEWSSNRYNSEISKNGIYSFFAAFRNNQMKYSEFYTTIPDDKAFGIIRKKLGKVTDAGYLNDGNSIKRDIMSSGTNKTNYNVVFVLVESFSASFMKEFGNKENLTPFLDSLAQQSIFFEDMYATGTRTVRGMEAVTLCIPPTPGQSIVKRPENRGLYTVNSVFSAKGYQSAFFYGGDGYFDNMNAYFGSNGFDIYDRGHGSILSDGIKARRTILRDDEVSFENAWGACDEDVYNKMLSQADANYSQGKPFFNFVMTTSNHRPYTYPDKSVAIPSGTGRGGAVQYTDYALGRMVAKAKTKPWYGNTIFVVIADHCASSAGKNEIDVANYHIPAFIFNVPGKGPQKVNKLCSQIDLFPTLFSMMGWDYTSNFFGTDIFDANFEERALIATYRKLALMKGDEVMVLSDQKNHSFYTWDKASNSLIGKKTDSAFLDEAIAWYQTADYLFNHKLLK